MTNTVADLAQELARAEAMIARMPVELGSWGIVRTRAYVVALTALADLAQELARAEAMIARMPVDKKGSSVLLKTLSDRRAMVERVPSLSIKQCAALAGYHAHVPE